jgi:hypothetical protein
MATVTNNWTLDTVVVAPQALTYGNLVRTITNLDLRGKECGYLRVAVGRGGVTALANGVDILCRPTDTNGDKALPGATSPGFRTRTDYTAAIVKLLNNGGGYTAGQTVVQVDGTGTPAADELWCLWGETAIPANGTATTYAEFVRVSKVAAATSHNLTFDSATTKVHPDNGICTSRAEMFCAMLPGGMRYELIFDFGDDAAGEAVCVAAWINTLDSVTIA